MEVNWDELNTDYLQALKTDIKCLQTTHSQFYIPLAQRLQTHAYHIVIESAISAAITCENDYRLVAYNGIEPKPDSYRKQIGVLLHDKPC